jgi:TMEM175 potassium channel family protein
MAVTSYNQIASRNLERIGALSDGLFAVAMTLIVLEIRVPDPGIVGSDPDKLVAGLVALAPRLATYALSFLTLGIFWNGQQTQLSYIARGDRHLSWIYLAFLAFVALMPFSTSLLAEFITFRLALLLYWANIAVLGLIIYGAWLYAIRGALLRDDVSAEVRALVKRRILVAQALYAFGALLSFSPLGIYGSIAWIVLVQLNFAVAPRIPWLSRI